MTTAINFNYQFGSEAIEICNKIINTFLPLKADRVVF